MPPLPYLVWSAPVAAGLFVLRRRCLQADGAEIRRCRLARSPSRFAASARSTRSATTTPRRRRSARRSSGAAASLRARRARAVLGVERCVVRRARAARRSALIGINGAGKSTLLKILSRITEMSEGRGRSLRPRRQPAGSRHRIQQELTGRENVFLNGAILGMTRAEIRRQFDAIVAFAGVERFLDTPVKHYSSGMYVRLAFAVAAHLRSEILIVDEVLAVGDLEFQRKCLGKMRDVASDGRTVLLVSHNMAAVANLCSRAVVLRAGRVALRRRCGARDRRVFGTRRRHAGRRSARSTRSRRKRGDPLDEHRADAAPTASSRARFARTSRSTFSCRTRRRCRSHDVDVSVNIEMPDGRARDAVQRVQERKLRRRARRRHVRVPRRGSSAAARHLRASTSSSAAITRSTTTSSARCPSISRRTTCMAPGRLPQWNEGPLLASYRWQAADEARESSDVSARSARS